MRFLPLLSVVALLLAAQRAFAVYTWHTNGWHAYSLTQSTGTWVDHETEAQSLGGHLVTINSEAENTWLANTFDHVYSGDVVSAAGAIVQIGYYFNSTYDRWEWISGEPVTYSNHTYHAWPSGGTHAYLHEASHIDGPCTWNANEVHTDPGGYSLAYGVIEVEVPEPTTLSLLVFGVAMVCCRQLRV